MDYRLEKRMLDASLRLKNEESFQYLAEDLNFDPIILAATVTREAVEYWDGLDPYDFCVQHVGIHSVVFGGSARLFWHPSNGFTPDESYCSQAFLARCRELGNKQAKLWDIIKPPVAETAPA